MDLIKGVYTGITAVKELIDNNKTLKEGGKRVTTLLASLKDILCEIEKTEHADHAAIRSALQVTQQRIDSIGKRLADAQKTGLVSYVKAGSHVKVLEKEERHLVDTIALLNTGIGAVKLGETSLSSVIFKERSFVELILGKHQLAFGFWKDHFGLDKSIAEWPTFIAALSIHPLCGHLTEMDRNLLRESLDKDGNGLISCVELERWLEGRTFFEAMEHCRKAASAPLSSEGAPCWGRFPDAHVDVKGDTASYTGDKSDRVVVVQSARAVPQVPGLSCAYYEVTIAGVGSTRKICIGLGPRDFPLDTMPGRVKGTVGYHGQEGKLYGSTGKLLASGKLGIMGPRFTDNCVVGCGYHVETRKVFFTCDGDVLRLPAEMELRAGDLFATVGLKSSGAVVTLNMGSKPFRCDLKEWREEAARKAREEALRARVLALEESMALEESSNATERKRVASGVVLPLPETELELAPAARLLGADQDALNFWKAHLDENKVSVTREQFSAACERAGVFGAPLTNAQREALLDSIDTNRDGLVSCGELLRWLDGQSFRQAFRRDLSEVCSPELPASPPGTTEVKRMIASEEVSHASKVLKNRDAFDFWNQEVGLSKPSITWTIFLSACERRFFGRLRDEDRRMLREDVLGDHVEDDDPVTCYLLQDWIQADDFHGALKRTREKRSKERDDMERQARAQDAELQHASSPRAAAVSPRDQESQLPLALRKLKEANPEAFEFWQEAFKNSPFVAWRDLFTALEELFGTLPQADAEMLRINIAGVESKDENKVSCLQLGRWVGKESLDGALDRDRAARKEEAERSRKQEAERLQEDPVPVPSSPVVPSEEEELPFTLEQLRESNAYGFAFWHDTFQDRTSVPWTEFLAAARDLFGDSSWLDEEALRENLVATDAEESKAVVTCLRMAKWIGKDTLGKALARAHKAVAIAGVQTSAANFVPWQLAAVPPGLYGPIERQSDMSARHNGRGESPEEAYISGDTPLSSGRHAWRVRMGAQAENESFFGIAQAGRELRGPVVIDSTLEALGGNLALIARLKAEQKACSYMHPSFHGVYTSHGGTRMLAGQFVEDNGLERILDGDMVDFLLDATGGTLTVITLKDGKRTLFTGLPRFAWVPHFSFRRRGNAISVEIISPEQAGTQAAGQATGRHQKRSGCLVQ